MFELNDSHCLLRCVMFKSIEYPIKIIVQGQLTILEYDLVSEVIKIEFFIHVLNNHDEYTSKTLAKTIES